MDDIRITGLSQIDARIACCRATSILCYLGIQDAPRKRRDSSRMAGAWAGSVIFTTDDNVMVLVTEEKWHKAKSQVQELKVRVQEKMASRKRLQEIRGFLNYIATTYPILMSYLMGLHLTIDGWQKGRDHEGWRVKEESEMVEEVEITNQCGLQCVAEGPEKVEIKARLRLDVEALGVLISGDRPPLRRIRTKNVSHVLYGFGDASGSAFGTTLGLGEKLEFEYGQWCSEDSEESSNWRELKNLVDALEGWVQSHNISGSQMFIFTDNSTAEAAYWKGTSRSKKLCELVLRMKCIALWSDIDLHVIHVSGNRMKAQGTDGLSRGDQRIGVMSGTPIESFIPLHLTPTQRQQSLKNWVDKLVEGWNFHWVSLAEWFEEHHKTGCFIWNEPPAGGDLAYEMVDKARLKRPTFMHIILIPRLFTGLWRRLMTRRTDCYIKVDWNDAWDMRTNFEPLLLFVCFPYHVDRNFEERKNLLLEKFQGTLQACRVLTSSGMQQMSLLREFLELARKI